MSRGRLNPAMAQAMDTGQTMKASLKSTLIDIDALIHNVTLPLTNSITHNQEWISEAAILIWGQ